MKIGAVGTYRQCDWRPMYVRAHTNDSIVCSSGRHKSRKHRLSSPVDQRTHQAYPQYGPRHEANKVVGQRAWRNNSLQADQRGRLGFGRTDDDRQLPGTVHFTQYAGRNAPACAWLLEMFRTSSSIFSFLSIIVFRVAATANHLLTYFVFTASSGRCLYLNTKANRYTDDQRVRSKNQPDLRPLPTHQFAVGVYRESIYHGTAGVSSDDGAQTVGHHKEQPLGDWRGWRNWSLVQQTTNRKC